MGRMLDALRQIEARRPTVDDPAPASPAAEIAPAVNEPSKASTESSANASPAAAAPEPPGEARTPGESLDWVERLVADELAAHAADPAALLWPSDGNAARAKAWPALAAKLGPLLVAPSSSLAVVGLPYAAEAASILAGAAPDLARQLEGRLLLIDDTAAGALDAIFLSAQCNAGLASVGRLHGEGPNEMRGFEPALGDVLRGRAAALSIVRRTSMPAIDLLPRGNDAWEAANPPTAGDAWRDLLATLRRVYRAVLVAADAPRGESAPALTACDGVVAAVTLSAMSARDLDLARAQIAAVGGRLRGAIAIEAA